MTTRIPSLSRYQRPRRSGRFADLRPPQRLAAEAHYQRLCARWGDNLPQWRRAILAGRAKDLVLRPRNGSWARRLRNSGKQVVTPSQSVLPSAPANLPASSSEGVMRTSERPSNMASSDVELSAKPTPYNSRLDIRGITTTGTDGYDTAQRILRDLSQRAFDSSPHFSLAVPSSALPPRWAWRLEIVPVP
jgi:hypothetical protein